MLALVLIQVGLAKDCSSFKCKSSDMLFVEKTCVFYEPTQQIHWVSSCQSYQECLFLGTKTNSSCELVRLNKDLSWPGEPCYKNSDCLHLNCKDHKCQGRQKGNSCYSDSECSPGLYCQESSGLCQRQIPTGEKGCSRNEACANSAYCNFTGSPSNSFCVQAMSVFPGHRVAQCNANFSAMCQNLLCKEDTEGGVCAGKVWSSKSLPVVCNRDEDCVSVADAFLNSKFQGTCECGYNAEALAYCELFPGDEPYIKFLDSYKKWFSSHEIKLCNSARARGITKCMESYYSSYLELAYSYYSAYLYPQLQNNDLCMKKVVTSAYYKVWKELQKPQDQDFSTRLCLSLLILASI